jgi:transposase
MTYMAQHPACQVGLEACGSAYYWGRKLIETGHQVKLLPPAYVKGFVYGNKNDINDAKAIPITVTLFMMDVSYSTIE